MNSVLSRGTILALVMSALAAGPALAHGDPVIVVEPSVVAAGGTITVQGTEMEPGEVFTLSLEGVSVSVVLGEATASGEGEEAGFRVEFEVPSDLPPGSYTVRAATEEGETAIADLNVTESASTASSEPAMIREPSGEEHVLDRSMPSGQVVALWGGVLLTGLAGILLVRRAIDKEPSKYAHSEHGPGSHH
jgi:hypothetical protein